MGLFGAGQGANDCTVGTPDGDAAKQAIKLEPDDSAWDVEHLWSVKELPLDRKRRDDQGQRAENTVASRSSFANRRSSWRATGGRRRERRDPEVWSNSGMSRFAIVTENNQSISYNSKCRNLENQCFVVETKAG